MGSLDNSKRELRKKYKTLRDSLGTEKKQELDSKICQHVLSILPQQPSVWTAYVATRNEVDPQWIINNSSTEIRWAYPVVNNETMKFFVPNKSSELKTGVYGIPEPDPQFSTEIQRDEIDGCLVPGLAFDRQGMRLGSGKGFYDRFLFQFRGVTVGLAYGFQLSNEPLPQDSTDVPVQFVATEDGILSVKSREKGE